MSSMKEALNRLDAQPNPSAQALGARGQQCGVGLSADPMVQATGINQEQQIPDGNTAHALLTQLQCARQSMTCCE